MRRRSSIPIGPLVPAPGCPGLPAVTLTLSVLLCIGALSDSGAAAAMAQSLSRGATTASERESVANLISNLNDVARKLCKVPTGPTTAAVLANADITPAHQPTALYSYDCPATRPGVHALQHHLLNLPPPSATI